MDNQKSLEVASKFAKPRFNQAKSLIPKEKKYRQNFIVYRIKLSPIEVSKETRDDILKALNENKSFIQIDEYTVMLNSIASIEPMGVKNQENIKKVNEMKKKLGMLD